MAGTLAGLLFVALARTSVPARSLRAGGQQPPSELLPDAGVPRTRLRACAPRLCRAVSHQAPSVFTRRALGVVSPCAQRSALGFGQVKGFARGLKQGNLIVPVTSDFRVLILYLSAYFVLVQVPQIP